jgi:hypothetical protein
MSRATLVTKLWAQRSFQSTRYTQLRRVAGLQMRFCRVAESEGKLLTLTNSRAYGRISVCWPIRRELCQRQAVYSSDNRAVPTPHYLHKKRIKSQYGRPIHSSDGPHSEFAPTSRRFGRLANSPSQFVHMNRSMRAQSSQ